MEALDEALLVASELVTNAVRATGLVAVQLRVAGPSLYVEVWDNMPGVPEVKCLEADAEGDAAFISSKRSRLAGVSATLNPAAKWFGQNYRCLLLPCSCPRRPLPRNWPTPYFWNGCWTH